MQTTQTKEQLKTFVDEAIKTGDFSKLEGFCLTPEYQALSYAEKNYWFVTSSKLKAFERCQLSYKYEYIDLVAKPEGFDDKDYFITGRAFDDLMTQGEEYFAKNYVVMDSRVSDVESEIERLNIKIANAKTKLNKDGSRSAAGVNEETAALERIKALNELVNKTQLTNSMYKQIGLMKKEFTAQPLFNQVPKKKVFFTVYAGMILKAELDDFEENIVIRDLKTSSNILNFEPEHYELQASFYNWLVEENTGDRLPVVLEIVDKHDYFSRSWMVEYMLNTLIANRGRIIGLLGDLKEAMESGIFMASKDKDVVMNSPYYGYKGYGRQTVPELF